MTDLTAHDEMRSAEVFFRQVAADYKAERVEYPTLQAAHDAYQKALAVWGGYTGFRSK